MNWKENTFHLEVNMIYLWLQLVVYDRLQTSSTNKAEVLYVNVFVAAPILIQYWK